MVRAQFELSSRLGSVMACLTGRIIEDRALGGFRGLERQKE